MSSNGSDNDEWPEYGDVVIALMGMSGAGKSQFIDQFKPRPRPLVSDSVNPGTQRVAMYKCRHRSMKPFWLIDTIGFNDQGMTDAQVLGEISNWMTRAYLRDISLTGIIYMHSIIQPRFERSSMHNLDLFERLVGVDALRTVLLVTTFWDHVPEQLDRSTADNIERQLRRNRKYWGGLVSAGAQMDRHYDTVRSALGIIRRVISLRADCEGAVWTRMQREMSGGGPLGQTRVGEKVAHLLDDKERAFDQEKYDIERERQRLLTTKDEDHLEKLKEREAKHKKERKSIRDDRKILQTSIADIEEECARLQIRVRGTDESSLHHRDAMLAETRELQARLKKLRSGKRRRL
ncbi:uncharacterized protein AB675_2325 [Cyphellophora attinorum]|uniref:G domain-containing protein n=1 Tax=Cyphellophora attinorum TaxID=1664694 RepID=A0A0N0NRE1_9EURO|nr:uncharacterized protein AB675_2325 [Phialophora attinorum]KPI44988.1 hypothetical protein AB675_2325 [Phialophora attinorum]